MKFKYALLTLMLSCLLLTVVLLWQPQFNNPTEEVSPPPMTTSIPTPTTVPTPTPTTVPTPTPTTVPTPTPTTIPTPTPTTVPTPTPTTVPTPTPAPSGSFDWLYDYTNTAFGWGPGYAINGQRPPLALEAQGKFGKYGAYFVGEDTNSVYLTFDEGYEYGFSASILDTLKAKNAHAVFFITYDFAIAEPELVQRMIDEGHTVGNHSYTHPDIPSLSLEKELAEFTVLHDYIFQKYGYTMTLFRFPMGRYSERTLAMAQSLGYNSVFWSFAYRDWETDNQPDRSEAYDKIMGCLHNGAIYLLHAVSETNAAILGDVIDGMRNAGYEIKAFAP